MKLSLTLMSFGVALLALPARAADTPPRKPGLWELSMGAAQGRRMVAKYCIDAATDAALQKSGRTEMAANCSRQDIRRDGNTITVNATCKYGDTESVGEATYTMAADAATRIDIKTLYTPPMMGQGEFTKTWNWVGVCPADMQPGDAVGPGGMKLNVITRQVQPGSIPR